MFAVSRQGTGITTRGYLIISWCDNYWSIKRIVYTTFTISRSGNKGCSKYFLRYTKKCSSWKENKVANAVIAEIVHLYLYALDIENRNRTSLWSDSISNWLFKRIITSNLKIKWNIFFNFEKHVCQEVTWRPFFVELFSSLTSGSFYYYYYHYFEPRSNWLPFWHTAC